MPKPPVLFARNLFLPEDLGGKPLPVRDDARYRPRGYPVDGGHAAQLHDQFPRSSNVRYHLYPRCDRTPRSVTSMNLLGATLAYRGLGRQRRGHPSGCVTPLAAGWRSSPGTPLVFLFHSEFYSEGPEAVASRAACYAAMAEVERRVRASARASSP
jgi:hypothetical protein